MARRGRVALTAAQYIHEMRVRTSVRFVERKVTASNAARGGLEREVLAELVEQGLTIREIAARVDRSAGTVIHWLREHGLRTRRARGPERTSQSEGVRFQARCSRHGETEFRVRKDGSPRCLRCRSEAVSQRRRRVKAILIAEAGGSCVLCGYDRHQAALEFHHVRPEEKRFSIAQAGVTRSLDRARAEAAKCVLLCANCHAEVECGASPLPTSILAKVPGSPGVSHSGVAQLADASGC